ACPRPHRPPAAVLVLRAGSPAGDDALGAVVARARETPLGPREARHAAPDGGPGFLPLGGRLELTVLLGGGPQAPVLYLAHHAAPGAGAGLLRGRRGPSGSSPAGLGGLRRGGKSPAAAGGGARPAPLVRR